MCSKIVVVVHQTVQLFCFFVFLFLQVDSVPYSSTRIKTVSSELLDLYPPHCRFLLSISPLSL